MQGAAALVLVALIVACGSDPDGASTDDPSRVALGGADGFDFAPRDVLVFRDVDVDDRGQARTFVRVVASERPGLCARVDEGILLEAGERLMDVAIETERFRVGRIELTTNPDTSDSSFVDQSAICPGGTNETVGTPAAGRGALEITKAGDTVEGSVDVVFAGVGRVRGRFVAQPCANQTRGRVGCSRGR